MKNVLFSICFLFISGVISAQNTCTSTAQPQIMTKYTESKDGTVSTKTCLRWYACPGMEVVDIKATSSSSVTLYKRAEGIYVDDSDKMWDMYVDKNGFIVFRCGKKAFYYRP